MKIVARITINRWDPLDIEVAGNPNQVVHINQAVEVVLPKFIVKGQELPPHIIRIEVRKQADMTSLTSIIDMVYDAIPEYRGFWNDRMLDYQTGSSMFLGLNT